MRKRIWYSLFFLFVLLPALALAVICYKLDMTPMALYNKATQQLSQQYISVDKQVSTVFLKLNVSKDRKHKIPISRSGSGGALASFGDDLVVMNHAGEFYAVLDDGTEKLNINPAANNFDEYVKASETPKYKDLWHRVSLFRYNDVLVFAGESQSFLLISYTEWLPTQECYGTAIAKLTVPANVSSLRDFEATAADWEILFRTNPCLPLKSESAAIEGHMAGGRMAIRDASHIVLGSGDYAWDGVYGPKALAQDNSNSYGKIIEINVNTGKATHLSYGHRNMQGIAVDDKNRVWVVEHGPRGGDELNMSVPGGNFGWPLETLGTRYNGLPWPGVPAVGRHTQNIAPRMAWVPSIATSSLHRLERFHPLWDGDFLIGAYRDGKIHRVRVQDDRVIFVEPIALMDTQIRDIHQHTDGRLVVWTDDETIIFITPVEESASEKFIEKYFTKAQHDEATAAKIRSALNGCLECHSIEDDESRGAPGLGGVFGASIASSSYASYSPALKGMSGKWTREQLQAFIEDPQAVAPGTTMPDMGLKDPTVINALIDIMEQWKTNF